MSRLLLTRRNLVAMSISSLLTAALSGCTDVDFGLDEDTPMPDASTVARELKRTGEVDMPFSIVDGTDIDPDPLRAEYMFRIEDGRDIAFRGWVATGEVNWYKWLQGYRHYWGCDYAQTLRRRNLPAALEAGHKYLDTKRFLADDSEEATVIVLLDSRDQTADAVKAIKAAWKVVNAAEADRHTEKWLADEDSYGLQISLRIASPGGALDPDDYLGGDSACLYYTGDFNPYGAGGREPFDAKLFISNAFDKVEDAQG